MKAAHIGTTLPSIDCATVADIIRDTAREEILPRFGNLSASDIAEKRPGDPVTIADRMAEERLSGELTALLPGSTFVGEEMTETDPGTLSRLKEARPVWILDPLDGTRNFANNKNCFVVIVALSIGGETVAGWIHDPVANETITAERGAGAWSGETRLILGPRPSFETMTGALGSSLRRRFAEGRVGTRRAARVVRYGSSGREHMDLARGVLHFARYGGGIKPWDHAAGSLIHAEAGGYAALYGSGKPYRPDMGIVRDMLLFAPDMPSWHEIVSILAAWSDHEGS